MTDLSSFSVGVSQTRNGTIFDFAAPTAEMVDLEELCASIWCVSRFNGQLNRVWAVGHHSELVARLHAMLFPDIDMQSECRMHDGSEGFTGDMPGPLKRLLGEAYKRIERGIERVIAEKLALTYPWHPSIKVADKLAQDIEATMMMPCEPIPGIMVREGFKLLPEYAAMVENIHFHGSAARFQAEIERDLARRATLAA